MRRCDRCHIRKPDKDVDLVRDWLGYTTWTCADCRYQSDHVWTPDPRLAR
jgi:hypothetical protein